MVLFSLSNYHKVGVIYVNNFSVLLPLDQLKCATNLNISPKGVEAELIGRKPLYVLPRSSSWHHQSGRTQFPSRQFMRLWLMKTPEGCLCESACLLLFPKHPLLHLNNDAFLFGWMPCPSSFSFTVTMKKAMGSSIGARHNINYLEKCNFSSKIQGYKQLLSDLLTKCIILSGYERTI